MQNIDRIAAFEIGVMFWAGGHPRETLEELKAMGIRCGQLGIAGDLDLSCAEQWGTALAEADFTVSTVFAAYKGESYADKPTVQATVGFVPPSARQEREQRTLEVSDFAAAIGAPAIATHVGCVPEDPNHPDYTAVLATVRKVCDHASKRGQKFALETGQEPAQVLMDFIDRVQRPNLGINFDPANMILYGTGDPVEALATLGPKILSVHCKDGDWPPAGDRDALGKERALGKGAVGMERFLRQLKKVGYEGPLNIEREAHDPVERLEDIRSAISLLRELKAAV